MSAKATRAHIHEQGHYYLTPLSRVGKIDQQLRDWLAESATKDWPRLEVRIKDEQEKPEVIASGYELERSQEILYCAPSVSGPWRKRKGAGQTQCP